MKQAPNVTSICLTLVIAIFLIGCSGANSTLPATPTLDPESPEGQGLKLYKVHCASCHANTPDTIIVGPSLAGVATRAETRIEGLSAEDYIYESIIDPDRYVVEGYLAGTMQQDFGDRLTSDKVNNLVAYLLTLD